MFPETTAIEIPIAKLTGAPNKSDLLVIDKASRVTLMLQATGMRQRLRQAQARTRIRNRLGGLVLARSVAA